MAVLQNTTLEERSHLLQNSYRANQSQLYWKPSGRLGNQIFEFSTAFCTALQSNHTPTVPGTSMLLSLFQIPDAIRLDKERRVQPVVSEKKCCFLQPHILEGALKNEGELTLSGYFHSYKYMLPCAALVKKQLALKTDIEDKVDDYINSILLGVYKNSFVMPHVEVTTQSNKANETPTLIGVHVRRTDRRATYPPIEFFEKAFAYYEGRYTNIIFVVCSDDIRWCQRYLPDVVGKDSTILFMSDQTKDYRVDFGILTKCQHSIVTAGTFSWWSGWLAGGEVVYHTGYDHWQQRLHPDRFKHEDFYPQEWIPMN